MIESGLWYGMEHVMVNMFGKHEQRARMQQHGGSALADGTVGSAIVKVHDDWGLQRDDGGDGLVGRAVHMGVDALSGKVAIDEHVIRGGSKDVCVGELSDERGEKGRQRRLQHALDVRKAAPVLQRAVVELLPRGAMQVDVVQQMVLLRGGHEMGVVLHAG